MRRKSAIGKANSNLKKFWRFDSNLKMENLIHLTLARTYGSPGFLRRRDVAIPRRIPVLPSTYSAKIVLKFSQSDSRLPYALRLQALNGVSVVDSRPTHHFSLRSTFCNKVITFFSVSPVLL